MSWGAQKVFWRKNDFLCVFRLFHETMRDHIVEIIHVNIFPIFFNILKYVFNIKEVYASRITSAFPIFAPVLPLFHTTSFMKQSE
jgi:hypothetical protein